MARKKTMLRIYNVPPAALIGSCLTALGRMRAEVEQQNLEAGTIVATVGGGGLGPVSELTLKISPAGEGRSSLSVLWRARKLGGDRAILPAFLDSVDSLTKTENVKRNAFD
ncbi:MAG TPA: hypothetical protein VFO07_08350 [Roseiflexaceae bacterium]|nr:hypothetical protein [Roseiflexaceae bacterium]